MRTIRFRRTILAAALVLALFLLGSACPLAEEAGGERVVRIGYVPNYCLITDPQEDMEKGYGFEYFREIAKFTGWTYEYIPCGWSEGLNLLNAGEIDIFGPTQKNAEREAEFAFPKNEMGKEYGGLFIHADNATYAFEDAKSYDGMRVATDEKNFFNKSLEDYCEKNDIEVQLIYTDVRNYSQGLKDGEYDAILNGSMMALQDTVLAVRLTLEPYYYITKKGNEALCAELDAAIEQINWENIYFQAQLYNKYYKRNPVNLPAFSKEEKAFAKDNPVIQVASDPYWVPIAYRGEQGNDGISVDVLREIGGVTGLNMEFVPVQDYTHCKSLMEQGKVSLLIPHTESADDLGVEYTAAFYEVPTVLVGRGEINLGQPMRVGVSNIQSHPAQAMMHKYPHLQMVAYENTNELLAALYAGKEEYVFVNTFVYDEIARSEEGRLYRQIPTEITFPLRFGVSKKEDPVLLSLLNKGIGRLSENKLESIVFANTVNRAYQVTFSRYLRENIYTVLLTLALFFAALIALILVANRRNHRKLERIAFVDELTGLPTLAKFQLDAVSMVKNAGPAGFLLLALDVDNFKYINDIFGYDTGNRILCCISQRFLKFHHAYRLIGRVSADTFLFLLHAPDREQALIRFEELLEVGEDLRSVLPASVNYNMVFSVGLYELQDAKEDFASWCDKANIARKTLKNKHTTALREYTNEMDSQMYWKKEITLSMEESLEKGNFKVYLQPKYRFLDGKIAGAEALVRWQHPRDGLILPKAFIPLFERNGFVVKLDFYMFEQVCALLREWLDNGREALPISVNLSRLHLSNPHLAEELVRIAARYQIPAGLIEIELTESIVLDELQTLIAVMEKLKEAGFIISVDDFGSGYSSLYLLTDLPVDVLKLDKGFLQRMSEEGNSKLIVEQVIDLAKKLRLSTVAEGVETEEQARFLKCLGCNLAQGYYFARPMPCEKFDLAALQRAAPKSFLAVRQNTVSQ